MFRENQLNQGSNIHALLENEREVECYSLFHGILFYLVNSLMLFCLIHDKGGNLYVLEFKLATLVCVRLNAT